MQAFHADDFIVKHVIQLALEFPGAGTGAKGEFRRAGQLLLLCRRGTDVRGRSELVRDLDVRDQVWLFTDAHDDAESSSNPFPIRQCIRKPAPVSLVYPLPVYLLLCDHLAVSKPIFLDDPISIRIDALRYALAVSIADHDEVTVAYSDLIRASFTGARNGLERSSLS
jgi:hypothetical protein